VHGIEHWTHFYTDYGRELQLRFFDHFLHGKRNGWEKQPKVLLQVRHPGERFVAREESEWPLKRTRWTRLYLDPAGGTLAGKRPAGKAAQSFLQPWATASPSSPRPWSKTPRSPAHRR
jgi:predicted acyl esterase